MFEAVGFPWASRPMVPMVPMVSMAGRQIPGWRTQGRSVEGTDREEAGGHGGDDQNVEEWWLCSESIHIYFRYLYLSVSPSSSAECLNFWHVISSSTEFATNCYRCERDESAMLILCVICKMQDVGFIENWMKIPIGSMYAIYGNIYHQYTPNVSIYTIHGCYGIVCSLKST